MLYVIIFSVWVELSEGFRLPSTSYLFINLTLQVIKPNLSEIGNSFCAKAQQYFWTKSGRVDFCLAKSIGGRGSVMWFSLCIEIVLYGLVVKFWKKTWDNWQSNGISPPLCRHGSFVNSRISSRQNVNQTHPNSHKAPLEGLCKQRGFKRLSK